jgi:ribose/xylose/arabinose/galactoside ABC-type transport system permease subunit
MVISSCGSCWGLTSNAFLGMGLVVSIGAVIGLWNGFMIAKVGLDPFLQTVAALIILEGARTTVNTQAITGLPEAYLFPGSSPIFAIGFLGAMFVLFAFVTNYTTFGQAVYGVGSDKDAARSKGVDTDRVIMAVYMIAGACAGLAGLIITGYTGVVPADVGEELLFPAYAAAVIGGIDLFGGRGKIIGALGGVLLLGIIQATLTVSGVPSTMVRMINGFVLLAAILIYNTQESIRNHILMNL